MILHLCIKIPSSFLRFGLIPNLGQSYVFIESVTFTFFWNLLLTASPPLAVLVSIVFHVQFYIFYNEFSASQGKWASILNSLKKALWKKPCSRSWAKPCLALRSTTKRFLTLGPISFSHLVLSWIQSLESQFYTQLAYRPHWITWILLFGSFRQPGQ